MAIRNNIIGVQHVGIPTADIRKSIRFYTEILGFILIEHKIVIDSVNGAIEAAFLKQNDFVVELFQPKGTIRDIINRKDGIIDHFALDAPDFTDCAKAAVNKGAVLHPSTPDGCVKYEHVGKSGVRGINFTGPNNEIIELCHDYSVDYKAKKGLQGWSHLAIKIRNLHKSVKFYESLGFQKTSEGYLDTPDGRLIIGFVELNGFAIELIQMCGAGLRELEERSAGHIDHIALDVRNIQDIFLQMKQTGYRMEQMMVKELNLLQHGIKYFMIKGPDGELIEFNEKLLQKV